MTCKQINFIIIEPNNFDPLHVSRSLPTFQKVFYEIVCFNFTYSYTISKFILKIKVKIVNTCTYNKPKISSGSLKYPSPDGGALRNPSKLFFFVSSFSSPETITESMYLNHIMHKYFVILFVMYTELRKKKNVKNYNISKLICVMEHYYLSESGE